MPMPKSAVASPSKEKEKKSKKHKKEKKHKEHKSKRDSKAARKPQKLGAAATQQLEGSSDDTPSRHVIANGNQTAAPKLRHSSDAEAALLKRAKHSLKQHGRKGEA